jgi:hypothetical protein
MCDLDANVKRKLDKIAGMRSNLPELALELIWEHIF